MQATSNHTNNIYTASALCGTTVEKKGAPTRQRKKAASNNTNNLNTTSTLCGTTVEKKGATTRLSTQATSKNTNKLYTTSMLCGTTVEKKGAPTRLRKQATSNNTTYVVHGIGHKYITNYKIENTPHASFLLQHFLSFLTKKKHIPKPVVWQIALKTFGVVLLNGGRLFFYENNSFVSNRNQ
jgi:hypothetical protein